MVNRSRSWLVAAIVLALSSVGLGVTAWAIIVVVSGSHPLRWVLPLLALLTGIGALPAGLEGFKRARREKQRGALPWLGLVAAVLPLSIVVAGAVGVMLFIAGYAAAG